MRLIQLIHDKHLGYPHGKNLETIEPSVLAEYEEMADFFLTFRCSLQRPVDDKIEKIMAFTRWINRFDGTIVCDHLAEMSEFAPIIWWDIAHTMSLGGRFIILGDASYLQKEYYNGSFEVIGEEKGKTILEKVAALRVEQEVGLDDWTFGIPVGPGDATALNAIVKRILELRCHHKEIILCGTPGTNFKYRSEVKIVGEDIPAPPVQICRKKNTIVYHAKYNNVCILHDRVFLPSDFMEAMRKYGDYYPFLGMQSIYMGDRWNRKCARYSDYNLIDLPSSNLNAVNGNIVTHHTTDVFESNVKFFYGNPCRFRTNSYLTGSMYIVKKSLWSFAKQEESLLWEDFEDIEQGLRLAKKGVNSLVNPYAFTQSIFQRRPVLGNGGVWYENIQKKALYKSYYFPLLHGQLKPKNRISARSWKEKIITFCEKYKINDEELFMLLQSPSEHRCLIIFKSIALASFDNNRKSIRSFLKDVQGVLGYSFSPKDKQYWENCFYLRCEQAKFDFVNWRFWDGDYLNNSGKMVFSTNDKDFFVSDGVMVRIGSFITALQLWVDNGKLFCLNRGLIGFYHAIINSTPFMKYVEDEYE